MFNKLLPTTDLFVLSFLTLGNKNMLFTQELYTSKIKAFEPKYSHFLLIHYSTSIHLRKILYFC